MYFFKLMLLCFSDTYPRVKLLEHMVVLFLIFWGTRIMLAYHWQLHQFAFPPTALEGSIFFYWPVLIISCHFGVVCYATKLMGGCMWSHLTLMVALQWDGWTTWLRCCTCRWQNRDWDVGSTCVLPRTTLLLWWDGMEQWDTREESTLGTTQYFFLPAHLKHPGPGRVCLGSQSLEGM